MANSCVSTEIVSFLVQVATLMKGVLAGLELYTKQCRGLIRCKLMFEILFHLLKAIKILVKNGKDMRRELLGVNAVQPKSYNQKKIPQRKISVASISMASGAVASGSVMEAVDFFSQKK